MFTLRVIQAKEGDCLLLLYGTQKEPGALLIDGGPKSVYSFVSAAMAEVPKARLDAVLLSHVDSDHVGGLLKLFTELNDARAESKPGVVSVGGLWLNAFSDTLGQRVPDFEARLGGVRQAIASLTSANTLTSAAVLQSIAEGHRLTVLAKQLGVPLNAPTQGAAFLAKREQAPIELKNLKLHVVGPMEDNLNRLGEEWTSWLQKQEERIERGELQMAVARDQGIPNLSSVQLLVKSGKKSMLLTGDGRGDHLLDGLELGGHLDKQGRITVDVLKMPHHGSDRNVDAHFFDAIRARTYVISADGRYGNPDPDTLRWIIRAPRLAGRPAKLVLTNRTKVVDEVVKELPPKKFNYTLEVRQKDQAWIDVVL